MKDDPIYISRPHKRSWGQEYRIYNDRIEIRAKILFTTLKIKFNNIGTIIARDSNIIWSDMYRKPLDFWWVYNNDWGGYRGVLVRQKGWWRSRINFTPENPDEFVAKCNELIEKHKITKL